MKVLLRNSRTKLYYGGPSIWVAEPGLAEELGSIERAAGILPREYRIALEVVLRYEEPRCELALPIQRDW